MSEPDAACSDLSCNYQWVANPNGGVDWDKCPKCGKPAHILLKTWLRRFKNLPLQCSKDYQHQVNQPMLKKW
jgi:hypothetical protein